jgi:hypothetical protein
LNNTPDINSYQKNIVEKANAVGAGYHASTPPNFSNSLLNQPPQPHPNLNANSAPATQFGYMISTNNPNVFHSGIQVKIELDKTFRQSKIDFNLNKKNRITLAREMLATAMETT